MSLHFGLGLALAAGLLLLGLGTGAYVMITQLRKMKDEYNETGFYPYGYFYQKGFLYATPLSILVGYLLLPYYDSFSRGASMNFVVVVWLPGAILGYILEKKNANIVRPRTEEETRKRNRAQGVAVVLLVLLIIYRTFIHKQ